MTMVGRDWPMVGREMTMEETPHIEPAVSWRHRERQTRVAETA